MRFPAPGLCLILVFSLFLVAPEAICCAQDSGAGQKAEDPPTKEVEQEDQKTEESGDGGEEQEATDEDEGGQPTLDELLRLEEEKRSSDGEMDDDAGESNILDELDGSSSSLGDDPAQLFLDAADRMSRSARRLLDLHDAGLETQRLQEEAILRLDILIDQARQRKRQPQDQPQSSSQNQNPQQQQQPNSQPGSSDNQDQDTRPGFQEQDMEGALEEGGLEWGHLPPRTRDMLTQGRYDLASSIYRRMTELYYRRLAEESNQ